MNVGSLSYYLYIIPVDLVSHGFIEEEHADVTDYVKYSSFSNDQKKQLILDLAFGMLRPHELIDQGLFLYDKHSILLKKGRPDHKIMLRGEVRRQLLSKFGDIKASQVDQILPKSVSIWERDVPLTEVLVFGKGWLEMNYSKPLKHLRSSTQIRPDELSRSISDLEKTLRRNQDNLLLGEELHRDGRFLGRFLPGNRRYEQPQTRRSSTQAATNSNTAPATTSATAPAVIPAAATSGAPTETSVAAMTTVISTADSQIPVSQHVTRRPEEVPGCALAPIAQFLGCENGDAEPTDVSTETRFEINESIGHIPTEVLFGANDAAPFAVATPVPATDGCRLCPGCLVAIIDRKSLSRQHGLVEAVFRDNEGDLVVQVFLTKSRVMKMIPAKNLKVIAGPIEGCPIGECFDDGLVVVPG